MNNIISIGSGAPIVFTITEADDLIPLVSKITLNHENEVQKLLDRQRYYVKSNAPDYLIKEVDTKVGKMLIDWGTKLTKLGLKVFGFGYVGFPNGMGFWSWHQGEKKIEYYHDSAESPFQRRPLVRTENAPQA